MAIIADNAILININNKNNLQDLSRKIRNFIQTNNIQVIIGFDNQACSNLVYLYLLEQLIDSNLLIINLDKVSFPQFEFTIQTTESQSAIVVIEDEFDADSCQIIIYNKAKRLLNHEIKSLLSLQQTIKATKPQKIARLVHLESQQGYLEYLFSYYKDTNCKTLWDASVGSFNIIYTNFAKRMPRINDIINSPWSENKKYFSDQQEYPAYQISQKYNYDLVVILSPNSKRFKVIDKTGLPVSNQDMLLLLAKMMQNEGISGDVISPPWVSNHIFDRLNKLGFENLIISSKANIPNVSSDRVVLATNKEGEFYLKLGNSLVCDALLVVAKLQNYLSLKNQSISTIIKENYVPTVREVKLIPQKIDYPAIEESLKDRKIRFSKIDGLRVRGENGYWLIAPKINHARYLGSSINKSASIDSNYLVLEAKNADKLNLLLNEVRQYISQA